MASTAKSYPPVLSGTLPSMSYAKGPVLRVPFLMNRMVAPSSVMKLRLRLKTTNTDTLLCQMDIPGDSHEDNYFPITNDVDPNQVLVA
jgi:hypothetical protein